MKPNLKWWWRLRPETRKAVREWYGDAITGHLSSNSGMSRAAQRAWQRLFKEQIQSNKKMKPLSLKVPRWHFKLRPKRKSIKPKKPVKRP